MSASMPAGGLASAGKRGNSGLRVMAPSAARMISGVREYISLRTGKQGPSFQGVQCWKASWFTLPNRRRAHHATTPKLKMSEAGDVRFMATTSGAT